jgi:fatty acid elongase 3
MAPLADAILKYVPLPNIPSYLTRWEPGVTPLSTQKEVVAALASYLAVIFGIQHIMKDKQPVRANGPFQVHNTILYLGSGLLLALIVEEIVPLVFKGGLFYGMCDNDAWTSVGTDLDFFRHQY